MWSTMVTNTEEDRADDERLCVSFAIEIFTTYFSRTKVMKTYLLCRTRRNTYFKFSKRNYSRLTFDH